MGAHSRIAIFAFLLPLIGLHGGQIKPATVMDDLGNAFPLSVPPRRIISLAPNITEILFTLGLDAEIAGVTRYCDTPQEALKKDKIGGIEDPDLEKILSLKPDLVVAFRGIPLRLIDRMKDMRVPVFILDEGSRMEDVFPLIAKIGRVVRREKEAAALVDHLKSGYDRTSAGLANASSKPPVFLSLHGYGLYTCGGGTFLNDLVEKAGAKNVAASHLQGWRIMNKEDILRENPEIIVILAKTAGDFEAAKAWFKAQPGFDAVSAVRKGRFIHLDENTASRFGPRLFGAFDELSRSLHPEAFTSDKKGGLPETATCLDSGGFSLIADPASGKRKSGRD